MGEATTPPTVKSRKWLYAVVAVVIIVVIVGTLLYWFFIKPQGIPWLFKGAYAKYYGETTVLFITVEMNMRIEVVDYNATHAKLLMYIEAETPVGTQEFQNVTWVNLDEKSYDVEGYNLKKTYEQEVYIEGFGTRTCIIYEYESETTPKTLMTMYVDKNVEWPVKIKYSSEATQEMPSMSIELTITESNISGLKK